MNRNSLLRSKTPLKRKTRLRAKRPKPRRSGRVRDREYLLAVKGLRCCLSLLRNCRGPVQAHHAGKHPLGRKADDSTAIPLCMEHHHIIHSVAGLSWMDPDGSIRHEGARNWQDRMIAWTRARLGWKETA